MKKQTITGLVVLCLTVGGTIGNGRTVAAEAGKQAPPPTSLPPPTMTEEELQAFLGQPLIARLATVRANGTPQIAPMWFLYEDGVIYMSTRTHAAKVKHIRANPRVAVAIDVMEAPLKNKVVIVEGPAEVHTTGVKEMTTKIYLKYMGKEGAATPAAQRNINIPRVILKITPQKIYSLDSTR